jgi:peptide chain release factor 1
MFEHLHSFELRLEALNLMLMDPSVTSNGAKYRKVTKEHSHVTKIVDGWTRVRDLETGIEEAKELMTENDPEMKEMARAELDELQPQLEVATDALKLNLLPQDPYEGRPMILEIRAGTGGDEAALFAADLFRMYSRFGETKGFKMEIMSTSHITVGGAGKTLQGFKEVIVSVSGSDAYKLLKFESGVHRVQRVPATESQGRIHTSAATVAVMPEPDEVEIKLEAKDLRIDVMRAGGPGGQSVNTTDSAVRIVHLPTGVTVQCQDEKSQHKNKDKAMRVLKTRLYEKFEAERHAKEAATRKSQVGSGDRSERIRTYNFPQNRLTDHRIGLTLYSLDKIISGELHPVVDPLTAHHQAQLLEESQKIL